MKTKSHLPKILSVLVFELAFIGASVTAPADRPVPVGAANDGAQSAPIVLAQFVPCPNGRCRR
jgi:hypothetical protein